MVARRTVGAATAAKRPGAKARSQPAGSKKAPPSTASDAGGTRERLLSAAEEAFAAHGLRGARVQEIVARAGVNERMLYHYFGDKDGLYLAVLRRYFFGVTGPFEEALGAPGDDPRERLTAIMRLYFDALVARPNMVRLFFHEALAGWPLQARIEEMRSETDARLMPRIAGFFADAAKAGVFREGTDPIVAMMVAASSFLLLPVILPRMQRFFAADLGDSATLAELRDRVIDTVLRGVLAPSPSEQERPTQPPRRRARR